MPTAEPEPGPPIAIDPFVLRDEGHVREVVGIERFDGEDVVVEDQDRVEGLEPGHQMIEDHGMGDRWVAVAGGEVLVGDFSEFTFIADKEVGRVVEDLEHNGPPNELTDQLLLVAEDPRAVEGDGVDVEDRRVENVLTGRSVGHKGWISWNEYG
jgi:hypothetical protein